MASVGKYVIGGALVGGIYGAIDPDKKAMACAFDGALIGLGVGLAASALTSEDSGIEEVSDLLGFGGFSDSLSDIGESYFSSSSTSMVEGGGGSINSLF